MFQQLLAYVSSNLSTFIVGLAVFLLASYYLQQKWKGQKYKKLPGPKGVPLYGNLLEIRKSEQNGPGIFIEWGKEFGDIYSVQYGSYPGVVLNSKEIIREAFLKHGDATSGRATNVLFFSMFAMGNGGIAQNDGKPWKQLRRMSLRAMRDFGMGKKSLEQRIQEEAVALIDTIDKTEGKPFNPHVMLHNAFSNVICSIIFGDRYDYDDPEFQLLAENFIVLFNSGGNKNPEMFIPIMIPFIPILNPTLMKLNKNVTHLRKFINQKIETHKEIFDPEVTANFMDIYLKAALAGELSEHSKDDLMLCIFDLFVTGSETSTTSIRWLLLYMVHYPKIQAKCRQYIREVVGQSRLPTNNDRPNLLYIEATLCELQRIATIVPYGVFHRAMEDVELAGYRIPKNTLITPNYLGLHMDPEYWGDPEVFRPERWIGEDGRLIKHDSYMPFATGPRECMGKSLALQEMFIIFVSLLQRFTFTAKDPDNLPPTSGPMGIVYGPVDYEIVASRC